VLPVWARPAGITEAGDMLYVGVSLSPSAGCLLVLSRDLKLKKTLYGSPVASFSSGTIVLQKRRIVTVAGDPAHPTILEGH